MKKLLIKIVSLITAAAVTSGGVVFGDDFGETGGEILAVNGSIAENEEYDGFDNENARLEYDDNSEFDWDSDWNYSAWESMNWDGAAFTYEYEDCEYRYGILKDGTIILLAYLSDEEPDEIDIPTQIDGKDVTAIGSGCFTCKPVTKIYLPSTVKLIGDQAFAACESLTSVEIPDSVTLIGMCAFENCKSLLSAEIPDSVTFIGEYAFKSCESLSSIVIPESVTYIGKYAFSSCISLSSIEINGAASMEEGIFAYCIALVSVEINNVPSIGDWMFFGCTSLPSIEIPNGVLTIGGSAFDNCSSLSEAVIPDSVISIGRMAFNGCDLKNIYYTGNENLWNIIKIDYYEGYDEDFANLRFNYSNPDDFYYEDLDDGTIRLIGYSGMGSVNIPKTINGKAVTVIGSDFLYSDGTITKVQIPDSVTSIEDEAFYNCGSLSEVTIPDSVTSIGENAFEFCVCLEDVYYTGTEENWGLIEIDSGNEYLTEAVCYAGDYRCEFLEDGSICLSAYIGNSSAVTIPSKIYGKDVTMIGGEKTFDCCELISVEIPDSVTKIGDYTFQDCHYLTSVEIPDSVVSIGESAFAGCNSLTSLKIPEGVSIGESAFEECISLTSLEIPEGVSIGGWAFESCEALTSIEFSDGVSIGDGAFAWCGSLTAIEIPDGVTSIGSGAFGMCGSLSSVNVSAGNENYTSIDGYLYSKDGSRLLCYPAGKTETSFTIPEYVTSLNAYAFAGCAALTSIEIHDGVTFIGTSAFSRCTSLTSIEIPNGVTLIPPYAFNKCTSLVSIEIPDSVTSIGVSAFSGCRSLIAVAIPESVTQIFEADISERWFVFIDCSPDLVIYGIEGSYAETYAKDHSIEFKPIDEYPPEFPIDPDPDDSVSVTIGEYTVYFTEYDGVLTITDITGSAPNLLIPAEINGKRVKAISETAFANAADLQSVYIPGGVYSIEGNPFAACPDLTDIYYGGTENRWYIAASGIPFEDDPLPDVTFHFDITGLFEKDPVKEAGKETVEAAIKFNTGEGAPVIYMRNQAAITEEGLVAVKTLNTPVILQMRNYFLKINPDDIKTPSNFSILVKTADSSDNIEQWADPADSLMIIPQEPAEGDFGMTVEINLSEDILPFSADSAPYLYHIDGSENIEDYSSALSCDKDSKVISVSLSHASKYLLTAAEVDLGGGTSSGSETPEPEVPTDPTNPTNPPDPTVPTDPTNPTNPPEPEVPTDPTNPTNPPEPEVPTDPTNPTNPPEPEVPTDPTNPTNPPEPEVPTDPTNPTNPPEPTVPTDPTNPSESSVHTTELPSGMFVVPDTTTRIDTASTDLETAAAANSGGSAFSVEFETEEAAEATVTEDEAQPVIAGTSSAASTTVPLDAAEVSLDTTNSSAGNSGDANAPIGDVGAGAGQGDKNVNTGDSSVSLTPLMIISAAVVFNGTALYGKKKKDK